MYKKVKKVSELIFTFLQFSFAGLSCCNRTSFYHHYALKKLDREKRPFVPYLKKLRKIKEFWLTWTHICDYNLVSSLTMERISKIQAHEKGVSIINSYISD